MKNLLIILFTIFSIGFANGSQVDSIPNAGFESWVISTWYEWPNGWQTNNTQLLAPTVMSDTGAHSGVLAMLLAYEGALTPHAWCDFHLTSHPINLGVYIKNHLNPNDSLEIVIRIYFNQHVIDSGYSVIYGGINPNYMHFIIPISQNSVDADSCEISFLGGTTFSSSVIIDDLQFDYSTGLPKEIISDLSFYPNPCTNQVFLNIDNLNFKQGNIEIKAYDISGREKVIPIEFDINQTEDYIVELNTESLNSGIWFIVVGNEKQKYKMMVVKI